MADVATPSAATMSTTGTSTPPIASQKVKPEKPDEAKYKDDLAKAEKELANALEKLNAVKAKLDLAKPYDKESPTAKRQQELRSRLNEIKTEQQGLKSSKGNLHERIRQLDATLKQRIAESKNARSKIPYKSVEEIDREIERLSKQVDSAKMKLVDEKKALNDISGLRRQRKGFSSLDESTKDIDKIKVDLAELKKGLDDPHSKALSEEYTKITTELDQIKAEQDEAYKSIKDLRDERSKAQAEQQEKWSALKSVKDAYYKQKKLVSEYENEAWKARQEKQKAERENYQKEKRRRVADQKLEQASEPAYMDEILTAEGLLRYFDPTFSGSSATLAQPGKFAAQALRKVENTIPGMKVMKRDEEEYFMVGGGKKGKKGKKGAAKDKDTTAPSETGKFNLSIGVIEELGKVNVETPMSQADVPSTVEKLKAKLAHWKEDQDKKTQENIAKAKKEIERLENEPASPPAKETKANADRSKDVGKKVSQKNAEPSATAELAQEKDAAADVAEDFEKVEIEDAAPE